MEFAELSESYIKRLQEQEKETELAVAKEKAWFRSETGRNIAQHAPITIFDTGSRVIDDRGDLWTIYSSQKKIVKGVSSHGKLANVRTKADLEAYLAAELLPKNPFVKS